MGVAAIDVEDDLPAACARVVEEALKGRTAALLLVHVRWTLDVAAVADAVQLSAGDALVVGSSVATVYARGDLRPADIVVTAIGGSDLTARAALSAVLDPNTRGRSVARSVRPDRAGLVAAETLHTVLLVLPAGTTGDQQEVVNGLYDELGPEVPIVGGGSDGDLVAHRSWQFLGSDVVENGVVAVALSSAAPIGVGLGHGLHRIGPAMVITDSDGLVVRGIDGRPALQVYRERVTAEGIEVPSTADRVAWSAFVAAHPLGLARRRRDEPRTIVGVDFETGALEFVSEVPSGSLVHLLGGTEDDMLAGARAACDDAVESLGGADVQGLLVFSCIARQSLLSEAGQLAEKSAARAASSSTDVVLAYSCGEIARLRGSAGTHNQTVVTLAI